MKVANLLNNTMNYAVQTYKTIPLQLIKRDYKRYNAKRYVINGTNQNVWISNKHLTADGTIKPGENIDYVFIRAVNKLRIAGITWMIPGIKPQT